MNIGEMDKRVFSYYKRVDCRETKGLRERE